VRKKTTFSSTILVSNISLSVNLPVIIVNNNLDSN
jgi:hypothetical protein